MHDLSPKFSLTSKILAGIEQIALAQGEINARQWNISEEYHYLFLANVDAVHHSTKLEGNTLTIKQVTKILSSKNPIKSGDRNLKEVVNYAKARQWLFEKANKNSKFDNQLILETHAILLQSILTKKLAGHYRESQNVISNAKTRAIVYLPPEAQDVSKLMNALIGFANNGLKGQNSPLITAALFHYHFATIHPFMDGNGRCARLLTNHLLNISGYTISRYSSLEKQHEQEKNKYYLSLNKLQGHNFYEIPKDQDLTSWIDYWIECLRETYEDALMRIRENKKTENKTLSGFSEIDLLPNSARLNKALLIFKKHQRLSAADYQQLTGLGRTQAVEDLNQLVKLKLIKRAGGGRSTVYTIVS